MCIHYLECATFISYSHNNNSNKKVSTMTSKSPLPPYFRAVSRTTNGLRLIPDCSAPKGLQLYNNHITYVIVIEQMVWIRKVVSTMILMMKIIIIIDFRFIYFSKIIIIITIFLYYLFTQSLGIPRKFWTPL